MKFNVNNNVRVRLTAEGLDILRVQHEKLAKEYPKVLAYRAPFTPPASVDGWTTYQLWWLMAVFGNYMSCGCNPPFETEIDIVETP